VRSVLEAVFRFSCVLPSPDYVVAAQGHRALLPEVLIFCTQHATWSRAPVAFSTPFSGCAVQGCTIASRVH